VGLEGRGTWNRTGGEGGEWRGKEKRGGKGREKRVPKVTPSKKILDPLALRNSKMWRPIATKLCVVW